MGDLAETIIPKSDQLNADDLISGPITITVRAVKVDKKDAQPCSIFYDGDNGKPYKPNKGMRRLLMMAWNTDDSQTFLGRSMTLWRCPDVMWAGKPEGGIRISHLSHISGKETFAITTRRGVREHIEILPLKMNGADSSAYLIEHGREDIQGAKTLDALQRVWASKLMAPHREALQAELDERKAELSKSNIASQGDGETSVGQAGDQDEAAQPSSAASSDTVREPVSLNSAKDQIDRCENERDANARVLELQPFLNDDDAAALRSYAVVKIEELKGVKA